MRFKTDENVHPDVAALLREQGHDAATVWDQSLRGATDANLAASLWIVDEHSIRVRGGDEPQ